MEVRNCRGCGRLFNYLAGPPICDSCKDALEDKFQMVKEFIRENSTARMNEVAEKCEVSVPQLQRWIREERLVLSEDSPILFECENCGARIRTGRFCMSCKSKLQGDLKGAYTVTAKPQEEKKKKGKDRMRFLEL